jgi:hypothetical protein
MPETPAILDACAKLAPDNVKIRTYAVTALSTPSTMALSSGFLGRCSMPLAYSAGRT